MRIECSDEGFFSLQECQEAWQNFQTQSIIPRMSAIIQSLDTQYESLLSPCQNRKSEAMNYECPQALLTQWQTNLCADSPTHESPPTPQDISIYFDFLLAFTLHILRTKGESLGLSGAFLHDIDSLTKKPLFIELLCMDSESMRQLNAQYMQKDYPTDVLSFPLEIEDIECEQCLGSIALNLYAVLDCAMQYRHNMYAEVSLLLVHAILHILGLDHESDNGEQRAIEQHIMEELHLPQSLIIRASGIEE